MWLSTWAVPVEILAPSVAGCQRILYSGSVSIKSTPSWIWSCAYWFQNNSVEASQCLILEASYMSQFSNLYGYQMQLWRQNWCYITINSRCRERAAPRRFQSLIGADLHLLVMLYRVQFSLWVCEGQVLTLLEVNSNIIVSDTAPLKKNISGTAINRV